MFVQQLNSIIIKEYDALSKLLESLNEQFTYLSKNDVFALDGITEKLDKCAREVAKYEVERRKITGEKAMSKIIDECQDKTLDDNYRSTLNLLHKVQLQKDINESLIKQGLNFTTQMLNMLKPDRAPKTYNAYGRRR